MAKKINLTLPDSRLASLQFYADLEEQAKRQQDPKEAWRETERWLGRNDLFYLLVRLLRRVDANSDWLFERCREVEAAPNDHLDLWAREHYKSTVITFALTVQDILNDPEVTVGFFSFNRPTAKTFLVQIMRELESNQYLKWLYSDILYADPRSESPKWGEEGGIIVKRKGNPKESTVEAWGLVDGQPTGRHFKLRVYDDVVTRESVTTVEQIKKTTDAWELSENLGSLKNVGERSGISERDITCRTPMRK